MTPMPNIGQMLSAQARLQPARIGARDLDREMSFALWNARACRLANALLGLGLSKGERVGVLAWNRVEWLEIYAAAAKAGLVAVPVNFRLVTPEIRFILQDCAVSAVIAAPALHDSHHAICPDNCVPADRLVHPGGTGRAPGRAAKGAL